MRNEFIYFMCYKRENEKIYLIVYVIKVEHG